MTQLLNVLFALFLYVLAHSVPNIYARLQRLYLYSSPHLRHHYKSIGVNMSFVFPTDVHGGSVQEELPSWI